MSENGTASAEKADDSKKINGVKEADKTAEEAPKMPKKYRRYIVEWEDVFQWLTGKPNSDKHIVPYCLACEIYLSCHRSCLQKHDNSLKHKSQLANSGMVNGSGHTSTKPASKAKQVKSKPAHKSKSHLKVALFRSPPSKKATAAKSSHSKKRSSSSTIVPSAPKHPKEESSSPVENRDSDNEDDDEVTKNFDMEILKRSQVSYDLTGFEDDPKLLVVKLCKWMRQNRWVVGTDGGFSLQNNHFFYMPPSGVNKDMVRKSEVFVTNNELQVVCGSNNPDDVITRHATLFHLPYHLRDAGAVLYSGSKFPLLVSLMTKADCFTVSHQDAITGISKASLKERNKERVPCYRYDEELRIPIVDNSTDRAQLKERMKKAMREFPDTYAIIVRGSGVYIWGQSWYHLKAQAECYHHLFEVAVDMRKMGIVDDVITTTTSSAADEEAASSSS